MGRRNLLWESKEYVKWKVAQSCPTLCDSMDYIVHGILLARILECVAVPFSRGSSQPKDWTQVSCITGRFFTSWVTRDLLNLGIELGSPELQAFQILYQLRYQGNPVEVYVWKVASLKPILPLFLATSVLLLPHIWNAVTATPYLANSLGIFRWKLEIISWNFNLTKQN